MNNLKKRMSKRMSYGKNNQNLGKNKLMQVIKNGIFQFKMAQSYKDRSPGVMISKAWKMKTKALGFQAGRKGNPSFIKLRGREKS